jgi:purine catabolism regulator
MVTVRDLLAELDGVRLLTGEPAVDVPVRWVHITELKDPTPWLSGGELLLTTGMQLNTPSRQREFVDRLADHSLAGLGFGTGFGHREVPPALIEAASRRDFPVFEISYETPFIAVTEAAFTQLVNEQYAVLRRALAAHERLERVVLAEQGLEAVAGALATLIGGAVLVCDARGEPLAVHAFRRSLGADTIAALRSELSARRAAEPPARPFLPVHAELADRALALPVLPEGAQARESSPPTPTSWLVAIKDSGPLSDFDRLTLHQAVTIVALELLRERVAGDTERRLAGDVLAGMVSAELAGAELERRLHPFGLVGEVAAIVIARSSASANPTGTRPPAPRDLEAALGAALREDAVPCLVATSDGLTCALVAAGDELEPLAGKVARRLDRTVGLGRPVPGAQARRSFHEARCAAEAVDLQTEPEGGRPRGARVATYKDLGSFQLLLSLQDEEALRLFCDSILGPIEAGDGHYGGELMRSLEAFIEENGQWERAAKRLYCHRHTLRYRIRRVEELTGRSLSSARDRIEFWLALRGREITT